MTQFRKHARSTAAILLAVATALAARPVLSDDTELLRTTSANPFVFFLLDTSASMSLSPDGRWVHANADDPRSKLYQVKRVLHEVLKEISDVHFGFASMNQTGAAARTKHWLYYMVDSLPADWPIAYPTADANGPVRFNADGTVSDDLQGDLLTFGPHLDATGVAGTCAAPLSLATQREKINRYAKLGAAGNGPTVVWIGASGNRTYRLTVTRPGNKPDTSPNPKLGQDDMNVKLELDEIQSCTGPDIRKQHTANIDLQLWTDFLMFDEDRGTATAPGNGSNDAIDSVAGFWNFKDVADTATCDSGHPFSGQGWEGNYDGEVDGTVPADVTIKNEDPNCDAGTASCYNVKFPTTFDPLGRSLDRGDLIPLDWRAENKEAVLDRLAPDQSDGAPDFRIATYFKDAPNATSGVLELKEADEIPLFASGPTRLSKMITDFRCFYFDDGNKCRNDGYDPGWLTLEKANDRDSGCRRPYLIILSDGADTCAGENPCADTANYKSEGLPAWSIAYGANCNKVGNPLHCMSTNTDGRLLCPQNAAELKIELLKILGEIKAQARAFASAAVPSVQAIVEDKIFLTNFTPFNGTAAWEGHAYAFKKPLPLSDDGTPDTGHANFLWDGGEVMLTTQMNADRLGSAADQRRVYYSRDDSRGLAFRDGATVKSTRRLLDPTTAATDAAVRYDLWEGFNIGFTPGNTSSEDGAQTTANTIIQTTLAPKSHTETINGSPVTFQYLLGDVFHSNPLVVGSPPNTLYFSADLHGYRDFFRQHELRRKILLMGANDGMLHGFDAGTYDPDIAEANKDTTRTEFNNGTGKELFAYIPRSMMPTVRQITTAAFHQWGVDGTVTAADVFIDPGDRANPDPDRREWRTVLFSGMREGGAAYVALDITQPDVTNLETTPRGEKEVPKPMNGHVPSCTRGDSGTASPPVPFADNCGPLPFPAALWEFEDTVRNAAGELVELDEDNNTKHDLGDTWSIPNVGRIRITEGGATVEKFVMVVGGGLDPDNKATPALGSGTWLYMLDVETGQAIYKRPLIGAAPSEPAAVDIDQDGFLDRIYIGTTAGLMYRVDLAADLSGNYPALSSKPVRAKDGLLYTVQRIPDAFWTPRVIFNASTNAGVPLVGQVRPIYFRPSVIFVPRFGLYALSLGTGEREDLFANTNEPTGRFYVFVDDTDTLPAGTVLDESRFQRVTVTSLATTDQYLFGATAGSRGWYLELAAGQRMITDPFALSGVSFFSTFTPDPPPPVTASAKNTLCSREGTSNVFIVSSVNANAYLTDPATNTTSRSFNVRGFVTNPFTESGQTKNPAGSGSGGSEGGSGGEVEEICDGPTQQRLQQTLRTLFPANCKFGNQTVDIKTISSDTRLFCIAPVPVCTIDKNWREH